jgi:hypothetical protein
MSPYSRRRRDREPLAKQMNFMPAIAQSFRRAIKHPLGSASKLQAFMSQRNFHSYVIDGWGAAGPAQNRSSTSVTLRSPCPRVWFFNE